MLPFPFNKLEKKKREAFRIGLTHSRQSPHSPIYSIYIRNFQSVPTPPTHKKEMKFIEVIIIFSSIINQLNLSPEDELESSPDQLRPRCSQLGKTRPWKSKAYWVISTVKKSIGPTKGQWSKRKIESGEGQKEKEPLTWKSIDEEANWAKKVRIGNKAADTLQLTFQSFYTIIYINILT